MRAYGQKDPLVEFKKEGFTLFQDMMDRIEDETVRFLFFLQPVQGEAPHVPMMEDEWPDEEEEDHQPARSRLEPAAEDKKAAQASFVDLTRNIQRQKDQEMQTILTAHTTANAGQSGDGPVIRGDKVGRNDPCPCGSGKKYKKCHGMGK
jgi:preprotein translocase subunit SecA